MYILLTAALAGIGNLAWRYLHGGWDMPTWLMLGIILGSAGVIEVLETLRDRRRLRRRLARRRAHARPTPDHPTEGAA